MKEKKAKIKKRPRKRLIIFAMTVILIFVVMNILIDNPYTHGFVRSKINEKMAEFSAIRLNYQSVKVGLLPPRVEIYGAQLITAKSQEKIIATSRIALKISYWSLFLAQPRIGVLDIYDLDVAWPPPAEFAQFIEQSQNDDKPKKPDEPITWPPQFEFPLSNLNLRNAKLSFSHKYAKEKPTEPDSFFQALVEGLDLEFSYNGWDSIGLNVDLASSNIVDGSNSLIENGRIQIESKFTKSKLDLKEIKIKSPRLDLEGTGDLNLKTVKRELKGLDLNISADVKGKFSLLGSFLDIKETDGDLVAQAVTRVEIPFEDKKEVIFNLDGKGDLKNGTLYGFNLKEASTEFNVNLDRIKFKKLEVERRNEKALLGKGEIKFNDAIDFSFEANSKGLHLEDLLNVFGVDFNVLDFRLTGEKITVKGRGEPMVIHANASGAKITEFDLPATPMERTRLPKSPECDAEINIVVGSELIDFSGTGMKCNNKNSQTSPKASPLEVFGAVYIGDKKQGMDLGFRSNELDLGIAEFFTQVPMTGQAQFKTLVHGPFEKILIDTSLSTSNFKLGGLPLGSVSGDITVDDKFVSWKKVQIKGDGNLNGGIPEGKLRISDMDLDTQFNIQNISATSMDSFLRTFSKDMPVGFGITAASGTIKGNLFRPLLYQTDAHVKLNSFTYGGEKLLDGIDANIKSNSDAFSLENSHLILGSLDIGTNVLIKRTLPADEKGTFLENLGINPKNPIEISLKTTKLSDSKPSNLQELPFISEYLKTSGVNGALEINTTLRGTLERVQGALQGSIKRLTLLDGRLAPLDFSGTIDGSKLDLRLSQGGQALRGRMMVDILSPQLDYEWFFAVQRMDLRSVLTSYFNQDPRNYVYFTGSWEMKGQLLDWWRSKGKLNIDDIIVRVVSEREGESRMIEMRRDQPVSIAFSDKGWNLEKAEHLFINGDNLSLRLGFKDCRPPANFNVQIDGIFDMALLSNFSSKIESTSGKGQIAGAVHGDVSQLNTRFEITDVKPSMISSSANSQAWAPVSIGISDLRPPIKNAKFKIVLENKGIKIESFEGEKGSGTISANGYYYFVKEDSEEADVTRVSVDMNNASLIFPVAFLKSFDTSVSGTLTISGDDFPYLVEGNVEVKRARSSREVDIRKEIISSFRSQSATIQTAEIEPAFKFDVNVGADKSINIINRNLQMLMSSQLRLTGSDIQPNLGGQIEIDKGKFVYRREFTMQKGLIIFDDPVKVDPSLEISAMSEVGGYRVFLNVSGRASNPSIEFTVDPPTAEDGSPVRTNEILVLLSSGRLPKRQGFDVAGVQNQRNESERAAQDAATAEALNLLVGQFEDQIEKLFDFSTQSLVKQLYVDAYVADTGEPVTRFNAPLNLAEDLDVIIKYDKTKTEVASEYALHENIYVSGSVEKQSQNVETRKDSGIDAGVDLRFRFSFQ